IPTTNVADYSTTSDLSSPSPRIGRGGQGVRAHPTVGRPLGDEGESTMSQSPYWDQFLRRATSRRRVLRGGLAGGAAAGLLVTGCATSSAPAPSGASTAPTAAPAAPGAAAPAATAAPAAPAAKYGGVLRTGSNSKPPHADVHQTTQSTTFTFGPGMAYNRLLRYKTGPDVKLPSYI